MLMIDKFIIAGWLLGAVALVVFARSINCSWPVTIMGASGYLVIARAALGGIFE